MTKKIMKAMTYKSLEELKSNPEREFEVLYNELDKDGFRILILNLGSHPTAYIGLPKNHTLNGVTYEELERDGLHFSVNGGLSYSDFGVGKGTYNDTWFLGWDYNHCNDYSSYGVYHKYHSFNNLDLKKWTTEEIFEQCKTALEQIKSVYRGTMEVEVWKKLC